MAADDIKRSGGEMRGKCLIPAVEGGWELMVEWEKALNLDVSSFWCGGKKAS